MKRDEADFDELYQDTESAHAGGVDEMPVLRFANVPAFVEQYLLPNWVHHLGDNYAGKWCTRWWEHAEAVTRFEALWEAFEVMRLEPAPALSTWIRDHFDPHMTALTSPHGTFWRCDADEHRAVHELRERWATVPPPPGMFPADPTATIQP